MSDPVLNPSMTPLRAAPETLLRAALANSLALLVCIAMVLGSLLVFALPWRVPLAIGGATLAHYAPLRDGDAQLMIEYGPTNTPEKWVSQNHYVLLSAEVRSKAVAAASQGLVRDDPMIMVLQSGVLPEANIGDITVVSKTEQTALLEVGAPTHRQQVTMVREQPTGPWLVDLSPAFAGEASK